MTLGKRLKQLRGKRTQQDVAKQLQVLRASYCHYEQDRVEPSLRTLRKMADIYGVSIDFLVGREDKAMNGLNKIMIDMIEEIDQKLYATILKIKEYESESE
jgi:transcriptional regulator with XRE-family HTH domain